MRTPLLPRLLAVVVGALFAVTATAEVPKPPEVKSQDRTLLLSMRNGQTRPRDPDATKAQRDERTAVFKKVAQNFVYSVAHGPLNGEADATGKAPFTSLPSLMSEVEQSTNLIGPSSNGGKLVVDQIEYAEEYGAAIGEAVKVVLAQSPKARLIDRVNAVRILATAARMPSPGVVDPCLAIIQDTQESDGVKLYAFQALRNLLEQSRVDFPAQHIFKPAESADRVGKIHDVLAGYVFQRRAPRDDKERAVIEFVRRDAVAALARVKDAVLRKPNKDLITRPAWSLLRVIELDPSVYPAFTIPEIAEAATGLGLMKPDPDMNLDVAAYSMDKALIYVATAALEDGGRSKANAAPTALPWKTYSARLAYALGAWRVATKSPLVTDLAAKAIPVFEPIEKQGAQDAQGVQVGVLTTWAENNPPKAWTDGTAQPGTPIPVYKDDPGPKLPFPAAPAAAPMLKTPEAGKKGPEAPPVKK
ncbi:MAG TPA: hypothetical protein VM597_11390 [Gemmataceae bacterium]|nr:hypothetical protein [Gemmataceae bacterium]